MLEGMVKDIALWVAVAAEGVSALIIALAIVEAAIRTLRVGARDLWPLWRRSGASPVARSHEAKEDVRLSLGRWLALALEFLVAADILRTAVAPSWNDIGQLAAIAAIRTALNFFLQMEIDKAASRRGEPQD